MSHYTKEEECNLRKERIGKEKINNQGCLMKCIEYESSKNIIVEFQDEYKFKKKATWGEFDKGKIFNPYYRLGLEKYNKQGYLMKIIQYNNARDIVVEFNDEFKTKVNTTWNQFDAGTLRNPEFYKNRIGIEKFNNDNDLMKIIEYNSATDITVKFIGKYEYTTKSTWDAFQLGEIKNPFKPTLYNVGIIGDKYKTINNGISTKEYNTWNNVLMRSFNESVKNKNPSYKDVTCCKEWLFFPNFYEWLHSQENFDKWYGLKLSAIDKDILIKGNKIYSPDTCCLVPLHVNALFTKNNEARGDFPIGVSYHKSSGKFYARCSYNNSKRFDLGLYNTPEEAFYIYKEFKESYIKQIAQEEFDKGTITKKCYNAMMNYVVEITD